MLDRPVPRRLAGNITAPATEYPRNLITPGQLTRLAFRAGILPRTALCLGRVKAWDFPIRCRRLQIKYE